MMKGKDDIYRRTIITKEGKEIDIVNIGEIIMYRNSLGDKFYKLTTEEELDTLITCIRSDRDEI